MQLTKLEIKGFKSFGDKVIINFDEGITGIVGPNGCGKSNVVDSIRWVLGEQKTRMLRSEKMENIIFNGTKKRKPTQLAEVSLTFKNTKNLLPTEYTEVTITRRYYRSGESEYLLNGISCRLKDITNLFMDTGIASNSYAIIELKMVDDILNDKDNSRRALFEEAAGISKFKTRKKETLKKLKDTDDDLDRVEDLLFEIEKNLKSLEKQAKQAEKYYRLKDEYKIESVALARKTVAEKSNRFKQLEKTIQQEQDRKLEINQMIASQEAQIEKGKTDLITKEKLLASRQRTLNEHVNKIRQFESERKIKNERLTFLEDKSDNLREQLEADKKSNDRASFSLESLQNELEVASKELGIIEQEVRSLEKVYAEQKEVAQNAQLAFEEQRKSFTSKRERLFNLKKDIEIKEIQLQTLKSEFEKTETDSSEQSETLDRFDEKLALLEEQRDEKGALLQKRKAEEERHLKAIQDTSETIDMVRDEMTQVGRKLDSKRNEYNLTKSLVENLEGFPEAIKFLKKKANWNKNAPLLSDIIACDDKYRVTIENYLEGYMNYYIVDTERQAFEAVNILSDASKGKANFFVLDAFDKYEAPPSRLYDNAIPATEIVEYDPKYRRLIGYILENVYIVKGGPGDIPMDEHAIFITESGKYTKRRFSVSGGSVGLFEGKRIGRAKNLEKLQKTIKELEAKSVDIKDRLDQKQQELARLKSNSFKSEIEELQREFNLINEEYISVKTRKEQLSQMLSSHANRKEEIVKGIERLTTQLEDLRPQVEDEEAVFEEIEASIAELEARAKTESQRLSEKSQAFNDKNIVFHQKQNRVESIKQEISYKQTAFESSKQRIAKNQEELEKNELEIRKLIDTSENNEDELIAMYDEKEAIEKGVNEAEKDYYAQRGDIDVAEKTLRELRHKRELADTLIMEQQNKLNETKLELSAVKERLSVEFKVDLDAVLREEAEPDDRAVEEIEQGVLKLREKIERIGPINPMAMEAYDEIKERHTFITEQKNDLIEAKDSLLQTIDEIDTVARDTFLDAFGKIKENFVNVFRSLFTEEDDCDLKLVDPSNPLESEIEIMAKPKGKRPLTINQLSGGEKTLTATSLLFSIYLLKPAPFCIFDEVDAPLDDANIDKFNNIIKKFSAESQFIIVTHNKRTMAATDIIYGITMIEQGVSKVVPVDLRELAD
ncbi:chromosome segregation protein SMC [Roseivirga thermotolerans]|uniref:Chromosome partition protein Smc n=1 Tax=Roseivirga thermotolerans TaxID=1758176 RepID=A0ABQ3I791_9BACT|nr:chromosome segregation protein SMC [Roseivirga thermotolerans]GHE70430.1 chromosome partition protein Smc [Roseivirga thermotolerans]